MVIETFLEQWQRARRWAELRKIYRAVVGHEQFELSLRRDCISLDWDRYGSGKMTSTIRERVLITENGAG